MSGLPPAVSQAIEWYARQASGAFDAPARQQFEQWLAADARHRDAWQQLARRLERSLAPLAGQPAARQALGDTGQGRRRLLRGALGIGALAVGSKLLTLPGGALHGRFGADLRTGTAERRRFALDDGSHLLLNAESAVDLHFSLQQRTVQLLRGAVQAEVQPTPSRPFVLRCPWGEAWLEGGRCLLAEQNGRAQLWALAGELELRAAGTRQRLTAGHGLAFDGQAWRPIAAGHVNERAWAQGLLEVHDQPLGEVVARLAPYHQGILQVSARAAALRISGVFTLDDSKRALAALRDVLPLRVETYLGVWTRIDHA
jgi:transmembrane sensor